MSNKKEAYKEDVAVRYAEMYGIPKTEARRNIKQVINVISTMLIEGYTVKLTRFFNFNHTTLKAKSAKDLHSGERTMIPDIVTVRAVISDTLKKRVQGRK